MNSNAKKDLPSAVLELASEGREARAQVKAKKTRRSYASLCSLLETPSLRERILGPGELGHDDMLNAPTLGRRELTEADLGIFRQRAEQLFRVEFSAPNILQAVAQIAFQNRYHPVRELLLGIEAKRYDPGAIDKVANVLGLADSLHRKMLRLWAISAVARVLQPGCKVDQVFILVGLQGSMKSSFFRVLAGDEFFSDTQMDLGSKDAKMQLQSSWIYEWPELASMQRARDLETVKAFLTAKVDKYRPPYGKLLVTYHRTSVIVGTTNTRDFLVDPSGNRRYWPVPITAPIDIQAVEKLRETFWGEAVAAFRAGESWWFTAEEDKQLASTQAEYEREDVWTGPIMTWVATQLPPFTTGDVLRNALDKPMERWTHADEMRIAAVLRKKGMLQVRARVEDQGERKRVRQWTWPEGAFPPPSGPALSPPMATSSSATVIPGTRVELRPPPAPLKIPPPSVTSNSSSTTFCPGAASIERPRIHQPPAPAEQTTVTEGARDNWTRDNASAGPASQTTSGGTANQQPPDDGQETSDAHD